MTTVSTFTLVSHNSTETEALGEHIGGRDLLLMLEEPVVQRPESVMVLLSGAVGGDRRRLGPGVEVERKVLENKPNLVAVSVE